jgi:hypothetical protein
VGNVGPQDHEQVVIEDHPADRDRKRRFIRPSVSSAVSSAVITLGVEAAGSSQR